MSRAYIRLDPGFDEHKESYPDGPYAALIASFCLAELQSERGRFRSLDYLKRLLGKRGRHVQYLVDHADLTLLEDGRVYVDGWDEWQEGDWKVTERVGRIRSRQKRGRVTPKITLPVTVPVTPGRLDSGAERSGAELGRAEAKQQTVINDDGRADLEAFLVITRRAPSPKQRRVLDECLDRHDLTGPAWAADIMFRHPDDPIGAVIEADKAYRAERIAEAQAAEKPTPHPRRPRGLPQTTRDILAEMKLLDLEKAATA